MHPYNWHHVKFPWWFCQYLNQPSWLVVNINNASLPPFLGSPCGVWPLCGHAPGWKDWYAPFQKKMKKILEPLDTTAWTNPSYNDIYKVYLLILTPTIFGVEDVGVGFGHQCRFSNPTSAQIYQRVEWGSNDQSKLSLTRPCHIIALSLFVYTSPHKVVCLVWWYTHLARQNQ